MDLRFNVSIWGKDILFTWRWWLVLCLTVIPWVVAWIALPVDKRKQYLTSGLISMVLSSVLDAMGISYDLWRYPVHLVPIIGGFFPWDFSMVPVIFVVGYEVFPRWSPLFKSIIISLGCAFVGEPTSEYLGLTDHVRWPHWGSFPIYITIYLISFYGGRYLNTARDVAGEKREIGILEENNAKFGYIFKNSFDCVYFIEKKHWEKHFHFGEVNDTFCEAMGYSREELKALDPRLISDQDSYNVDVKYRPLLNKGNMVLDTTFVTKSGEKRYVRLNVKVFWKKDKVEILTIAKMSEKKVVEDNAT